MASSKEFQAPGQEHDARRVAPKLTAEEMMILKECNFESLWYRCIPLGIVFMGTTQYLVKLGYLSGHPKYGSLFKNMGALFIGYLAGKISYQSTCREKILTRIPNSRLAQSLSGKKPTELQSEFGAVPDRSVDDAYVRPQQQQSFDIDTNRSSSELHKGLDDNFRPTIDREVKKGPLDDDQSFRFSSYDELRKQNRQELEKSASVPAGPLDPVPRRRPEQPPWQSTRTDKKKNQYGDEWDE